MAFINISTNQTDCYILVVCQTTRLANLIIHIISTTMKNQNRINSKKMDKISGTLMLKAWTVNPSTIYTSYTIPFFHFL